MIDAIADQLTKISGRAVRVESRQEGILSFCDHWSNRVEVIIKGERLYLGAHFCMAKVHLAEPDSLDRMAAMIKVCSYSRACEGCKYEDEDRCDYSQY